MLSAWRNMSIDDFSKILKMVCVLSFRYNVIGGKDPKIMEIEYNKIAKKIESGEMKNAKQIFEEIKSKLYIEDSEFRDIFKNKKVKISKRKLIKYILIHIENHLNSENRNYLSDNATIEHILPENPSLVWEIDF